MSGVWWLGVAGAAALTLVGLVVLLTRLRSKLLPEGAFTLAFGLLSLVFLCLGAQEKSQLYSEGELYQAMKSVPEERVMCVEAELLKASDNALEIVVRKKDFAGAVRTCVE